MTAVVGTPINRIDGRLKVTGGAAYTSDHHFAHLAYGVPVCSTIAAGELVSLDTSVARRMPGVLEIFEHGTLGPLTAVPDKQPDGQKPINIDERRPPLSDTAIGYHGQYIALVVAETFEAATAAAAAVRATYRVTDPTSTSGGAPVEPPKIESQRGDVDGAFASAPVRVDALYQTPPETHNPIELHATTAVWNNDSVTLYETSQAVVNHRDALAVMLGLPPEKVRVISLFLGSGFGGKLWPWTQSPLAAAAARSLRRPVKIVVTREMMFQSTGHRPYTHQQIRVGATQAGKLVALDHDYYSDASMLGDYAENCGEATPFFYSVPNVRVRGGIKRRHIGAPTSMRGPGAVPGLFATESALDELAIALNVDPVKLRIDNEPAMDEGLKLPFSSRHYVECLTQGAKTFGWDKRSAAVGSMKANGSIVGWGVAGAAWIAERFAAEALVELRADGSVHVHCGTQDIGTGTYTMLAQITADAAGVPVSRVHVKLGDTNLPPGPTSGGSMVTASIVPVVLEAVRSARASLGAANEHKPFAPVLRELGKKSVTGKGKSEGTFGEKKPTVSRHSYGAHFVEVHWQPDIAQLRVARVVTVMDAGRIVNPKTARNQIAGAIVMGVGMAMFEETHYDEKSLVPLNRNLADYVMATNADAPHLDIAFLNYPDKHVNELGARGVGEIGLAGIAPAITAAVYHATGKRIRSLPVTIEKLLA